MASFHVSFRLSQEAWKHYSAEAELRDLPLGTYLRRRLELQDLDHAADGLRGRAATAPEPQGGTKAMSPVVMSGTLVELVLLLRGVAGLQKCNIAQKEVERRGLPVCD